ncbi:hypothetical protein MRX96_025471 [Rhipicephalus microplus]
MDTAASALQWAGSAGISPDAATMNVVAPLPPQPSYRPKLNCLLCSLRRPTLCEILRVRRQLDRGSHRFECAVPPLYHGSSCVDTSATGDKWNEPSEPPVWQRSVSTEVDFSTLTSHPFSA